MENISLPDALTFVVPFLVTMLSHYLRSAKLPAAANGPIALASILVTAIACVWLSGSWTGDPQALTTLVLLYVGYLVRNDFQSLMAWLFASDSPLAPENPASNAVVAPSGTFSYPATMRRSFDRPATVQRASRFNVSNEQDENATSPLEPKQTL